MLHQPTVLCIGYAVPQGCVSGQPTTHGAADGRHDHKIMVQLQNGA